MKESILFPNRVSSRSTSRVRVMCFSGEDGRQCVAFPAADVRFGYWAVAFLAIGLNNDLTADEGEGSPDGGGQGHMLAGVGTQDPGDGTGLAKIWDPVLGGGGGGQKAAFLMVPAPVIVTIEIFAFSSGWGSHGGDYSMGWLDFCWNQSVSQQESNTPP
jgi:hypothetical protein